MATFAVLASWTHSIHNVISDVHDQAQGGGSNLMCLCMWTSAALACLLDV